MNSTTAIQRAEQWRKENACGEAAKVAIALLNELQALQAFRALPEGHVVVPGWQPIEQCKRENGKRYLLQKDCGDRTLPSITIGFSLDGTDKWFYNDGPIKSIEGYGYRVTHFQEMPGYAAAPANKEGV